MLFVLMVDYFVHIIIFETTPAAVPRIGQAVTVHHDQWFTLETI